MLYNHIPESLEEILNEYIFDNRYIKIDNKVLTYKYIKDNRNKNIKVIDLVDMNDKFLSQEHLNETIDCKLTTMEYNSLVTAIPQNWKKTIQENSDKVDTSKIITNLEPHLNMYSI